jgi:hypothetical protein
MPAPYCTIEDVLRRFDPSLDPSDLDQGNIIGADSTAQIQARIRSVSQDWDRDTGTPLRLRREGSPGAPRTYEHHDANPQAARFPLRVDLDHNDIVPFNASAGDAVEIRTGRDSWEDITSGEGEDYVLLYEEGEMKLFQLLVQRVWWEAPDERYLRTTYRYGSLGGSRRRGGETTLSGDVTDAATTLSVADASRLPADGGIFLVAGQDGSDNEYVRATGVDTKADEVSVTRGANGTSATTHSSGAVVHYSPEDVRDAVAGQAAAELVRYDLSLNRTDGENAAISPSTKLDDWQQEYQRVKAQYSAVWRM